MTDQEIKVLFSRRVLDMKDKAKEDTLRYILFSTHNKIDWQEAYLVLMNNMPELRYYEEKEIKLRASGRIEYDNDLVVVIDKSKIIYKGLEDYEPMKYEAWKFVETTKSGKGHYEYNGYKKYKVS